ncbi:G-protein coupled receptor Mth2-like isoform X7 [Coccinella septempunctata]|uniref:G-protein coupled receptor Mth2-like isoform X7 n=1 Tax=Coccinella septempunctata TaxID=41139 RepID=UPI001D085970|nr:G-protein coupled receptor Mth2-like isoform X7 [Coccinella septempunctata]
MWYELLQVCLFFSSISCQNILVHSISKDMRFDMDLFSGYEFNLTSPVLNLRKCCPFGEKISGRKCRNKEQKKFSEFRLDVIVLPLNIEIGNHCSRTNSSRIMIELDRKNDFVDLIDGSLHSVSYKHPVGKDDYCLDHIDGIFRALVCYVRVEENINPYTLVGMIISMPFLLVTFLVYALLPDRNLHMKALMCYVINLLHAYIFLVTIQLTDEVFEDTVCAILGYCCVFFFLASFFWMNVICVDIFLGFRGFRGVPGVRSSERKRFILYCIYAWGMSLLIVFITFMVNHFGNVGQWFYPGVAVGQCFIRNGIPQLLYFYGPMGIIIILNVVLFTLTAMRIRRVKKDTAMLKHSESKRHSDDDQQNFNLYLKLLLAMGVNWSMELVSWAVNLNNKAVPQYVWYLSDFCNATYGVFIFFIFVFKRNIWKQLRRRYYSFMGRHHMAHSMGTTNFTKTTNDSMTVSTNDRALEESELNGTRIN